MNTEAAYSPFDPDDPIDAVADIIRQKVAALGLEILNSPEFSALDMPGQITAFTSGAMVGVVGIALAFAPEDRKSQKEVEKYIASLVPQACEQAKAIMEDGPTLQ